MEAISTTNEESLRLVTDVSREKPKTEPLKAIYPGDFAGRPVKALPNRPVELMMTHNDGSSCLMTSILLY